MKHVSASVIAVHPEVGDGLGNALRHERGLLHYRHVVHLAAGELESGEHNTDRSTRARGGRRYAVCQL